MMVATKGSVDLLVILYSINVFITFSLSQAGMVRHWWQERTNDNRWLHKLAINGFGLILTASILVSLTIVKFNEGGWATLLVTGILVVAAFAIKRHYNGVTDAAQAPRLYRGRGGGRGEGRSRRCSRCADPKARTAVILVNGFNGLGLHTILNVPRMFGNTFRNFIFVQVGSVDAGNFKGAAEIDDLQRAHRAGGASATSSSPESRGYGSKAFTGDRLRYHERGDEACAGGSRRNSRTRSSSRASCSSPTRRTSPGGCTTTPCSRSSAGSSFLSMPFVVLPIRVDS